MVTGTTSSGFAFSVEDDALDDYELLEALVAIDKGDSGEIVTAITQLLGEEQKNALKDHLRGIHGRVSSAQMGAAFQEILTEAGKNSEPSPT